MDDAVMTRFEEKVCHEPNTGCWLYMGTLTTTGYGRAWNGQRLVPAHRLAYEAYVGPVPDGLEIDHLCRVRACVNPDHLEAVTHRESCLRSPHIRAYMEQTHCINGHPFAGDNLKLEVSGTGVRRRCRQCKREEGERRRIRARAERTPRERVELTHCKRGHEFTSENTYVQGDGSKKCRACARLLHAERVARRAA